MQKANELLRKIRMRKIVDVRFEIDIDTEYNVGDTLTVSRWDDRGVHLIVDESSVYLFLTFDQWSQLCRLQWEGEFQPREPKP